MCNLAPSNNNKMKTVTYNIKPSHNGYTLRILKSGRIIMQPLEFITFDKCISYMTAYCMVNNVKAKEVEL